MTLSEDMGAAICVLIAWILGIGVGYCQAKESEKRKRENIRTHQKGEGK
jgi:hypothetical protein